MTDPLILAHSRAVAAPKRQPAPTPTRRPVHAMCLAMSEVYQWVAPVAVGDGIADDTAAIQAGTPVPSNAEIVRQALVRLTPPRFVCIRAHKGTNDWKVGDIAVVVSANEPDNWRPCDADGWIAHVPTADAVCPVPEGVEFEVKRRMGCVSSMDRHGSLWRPRGVDSETEPTAWRPVVQ